MLAALCVCVCVCVWGRGFTDCFIDAKVWLYYDNQRNMLTRTVVSLVLCTYPGRGLEGGGLQVLSCGWMVAKTYNYYFYIFS